MLCVLPLTAGLSLGPCRNRIALIQKEEERARKKIQQTKERAAEILALRHDNEERLKAYSVAATEVKQLQRVMLAKNREQEVEGKKAREQRFEMLQNRRKEEVGEMVMERKYLTQLMIEEQQRDVILKQSRREKIRRMEEEVRLKKEAERKERERRTREQCEQKLALEAAEAKRAEQLVKALERKEREWIEKLRASQSIQESAFNQLERALTANNSQGLPSSTGGGAGKVRRSVSANSSQSKDASPAAHGRGRTFDP